MQLYANALSHAVPGTPWLYAEVFLRELISEGNIDNLSASFPTACHWKYTNEFQMGMKSLLKKYCTNMRAECVTTSRIPVILFNRIDSLWTFSSHWIDEKCMRSKCKIYCMWMEPFPIWENGTSVWLLWTAWTKWFEFIYKMRSAHQQCVTISIKKEKKENSAVCLEQKVCLKYTILHE